MTLQHGVDIHPQSLSHMDSGEWPKNNISLDSHVDLTRSGRLKMHIENILTKQAWNDVQCLPC